MTPQFADCIAPLSPEQFMAEYRGQQVAHFRGGRDTHAPLVDLRDLSGVLSRLVVTAGLFRVLPPEGDGPSVDVLTAPFASNRDRRAIRPAALEAQLARGATLALEHSEAYFENVHAFCTMLMSAFMARVNATLFVVYRPGQPCGRHWDDRDMFICQVAGRKTWPVYEPVYPHPLFDSARSGGAVAPSRHVGDFVLEPGDALYLPRGWPHNPASVDGLSAHVAFSIATPTGSDLLDWMRADLTRTSAEVRADLPLLKATADRRAYARQLRETVMARLSDENLDLYYQRHQLNTVTRPVTLPEGG